MSDTAQNKWLDPYFVWGGFMLLTIIYGFFFAGPQEILSGLWTIFTSTALLPTSYIYIAGLGPALVNSALAGLLCLVMFRISGLKLSGIHMGAFGLVMGFALFGKNPANMLPIFIGAYLYSLYKKRPYKEHVTLAAFSTCLAPVVSQPGLTAEFIGWFGAFGAVAFGVFLGLLIGFFINSMGIFIRKSHEGLNLYNIGWGAGLLAIGLTAIYAAMGITPFGTGPGHGVGLGHNAVLMAYLGGASLYFIIIGFLAKPKHGIIETLNFKADDNNFYAKYGAGNTYLAQGILGILAFALMLVFQVDYTAAVLGSIISMMGWGGFGKSFANASAIIAGVLLGGLARFLVVDGASMSDGVIFTSAFWGTCLSPMAKFFGWGWALPIGFLHFTFAATIAPFHWSQQLYNNGLAAGFVCVVMIPIIRAIDKKGRYEPKA